MFRPHRFRLHPLWSSLQSRRPRHPIVRAMFGLFAICAFIVLLVVGAAIAAIVMVAGLLLRALRPQAQNSPSRPVAYAPHVQAAPSSNDGDVIDGEYSVLRKSEPRVAGR